jgi:hypothetical protein
VVPFDAVVSAAGLARCVKYQVVVSFQTTSPWRGVIVALAIATESSASSGREKAIQPLDIYLFARPAVTRKRILRS